MHLRNSFIVELSLVSCPSPHLRVPVGSLGNSGCTDYLPMSLFVVSPRNTEEYPSRLVLVGECCKIHSALMLLAAHALLGQSIMSLNLYQ